MDKETRNTIERATQRARKLLEEDFTAQLEGDFDVHKSGELATKAGRHLSARQAFQRERITGAIEHKRAAELNAADSVVDYLRDAAFTTLNRFVALKMLEARELLQECITKGEQSAGYREFCGMAPGLPLLPESAGYRIYVESLFDELSTEVKVLFDRRDPSSVLWPKRATFERLLEILNADELVKVWVEDETIGWVYQFFNGHDERRKMRDESQAPRSSRELAVRNQFFTPRYVVQFLTDNTLGRIWYEMRSTKTAITTRCEYLVKAAGQRLASRVLKDPRDLRLLDPACGSGHFLLYAFELLLTIYQEAYADADSPISEATGRRLVEDYPNLEELRKDIPRLILAHNLHGVDIDPRCAQIAQLSLWMRAQRAYRDFGLSRVERPPIWRSNIVIAEPLVTADKLCKDFVSRLDDAELGRMFTEFVEALQLAGELGLLLRLETLFARAPKLGKTGDLFAPPEARIRAALDSFVAEEGGRASARKKLFVDDAAQGMGLLAVAEKRFDVVLMNPPFGEVTPRIKEYASKHYSRSKSDILCMFVERAAELLLPSALCGAITNRTPFFTDGTEAWRATFFLGEGMTSAVLLADLGHKVLDAALVETAAFILERESVREELMWFNVTQVADKQQELLRQTREFCGATRIQELKLIPGKRLAYWLPSNAIRCYADLPSLASSVNSVDKGMSTTDDFRFIRVFWEVPKGPSENGWMYYSKGGDYSPFAADVHLTVNWRRGGREISEVIVAKYPYLKGESGWVLHPETHHGLAGLTYTKRTTSSFSARFLPAGARVSDLANLIYDKSAEKLLGTLVYMSTSPFHYLLDASVPSIDSSAGGTAARHYEVGTLRDVPIPASDVMRQAALGAELLRISQERYVADETTTHFRGFPTLGVSLSLRDGLAVEQRRLLERQVELIELHAKAETRAFTEYRLDAEAVKAVYDYMGPHPGSIPDPGLSELLPPSLVWRHSEEELTAILVRAYGGKRRFSKQTWIGGREIELWAYVTNRAPRDLAIELMCSDEFLQRTEAEFALRVNSYLLGVAFGRWDVRCAIETQSVQAQLGAMAPLPSFQPGRLIGAAGGPPSPEEGRRLVAEGGYPLDAAWDGIMVDDPSHQFDVIRRMQLSYEVLWGDRADEREQEACTLLGASGLREWFSSKFFARHLAMYSKSRRKAPIYWQLATPSASYSVWLHIQSLSKDTLFRVQNDFVAAKLAHEERRLDAMTFELREKATATDRKALANQQSFVEELRTFLEEVIRVAPLWDPNLDDGVIINHALLWRLVPQNKSWQKELNTTWAELCEGMYDWAQLAMHLWPERVLPKCAKDRSLAIAHGLEEVFWLEGSDGKWTARKTPTRAIDELVRERTSVAVKSALKSLLEAPMASSKSAGRKGIVRRSNAAATEGGDA